MSTHRPTFYGIDPEVIESVTRKARRQRSEAVWKLLGGLFPSVTDEPPTNLEPANDRAGETVKKDAA